MPLNQENQNRRTHENTFNRLRDISIDDNKVLDWVPAEPFKELEFIGLPSYVDMECAIYIQDKSRSEYIVLMYYDFCTTLLWKSICLQGSVFTSQRE